MIAASSIDGIFVFDKDYCCLYANPAAAGYIPNTIKTAAGWTLFDLLSDSAPYIRCWIDEIERVFQTSKRRVKTNTLSIHNQSVFIESVFSPVLNAGGELTAVSLVLRDLTDRMRMEQLLADYEKKYIEICKQSPVYLYRTRIQDGKLLECSKALADLLGYSNVEECKSLHYSTRHYVNPGLRKKLLTKLQKKKKIKRFEAQIRRVDGKPLWIETSVELYPEQGYLEGTIKDITIPKVLTAIELEILGLVLKGKSNKEIAKHFCRSVRTIEDHRANIMSKLDVHNLVELASKAQAFAKPCNLKIITKIFV